jgi:hypothetical protein
VLTITASELGVSRALAIPSRAGCIGSPVRAPPPKPQPVCVVALRAPRPGDRRAEPA